jgi:hypothetical protein
MSAAERNEIIRLLTLIQQDVSSLMGAMESGDLLGDDREDGAE